jgi:hypothetical protein
VILDMVERKLLSEPATETRNRKRRRPNCVSEWELRIGGFRVFDDVMANVRLVKVVAVGYEEGNRLFLNGQEFEL